MTRRVWRETDISYTFLFRLSKWVWTADPSGQILDPLTINLPLSVVGIMWQFLGTYTLSLDRWLSSDFIAFAGEHSLHAQTHTHTHTLPRGVTFPTHIPDTHRYMPVHGSPWIYRTCCFTTRMLRTLIDFSDSGEANCDYGNLAFVMPQSF